MEFLWVGGAGGMEAELVKRTATPYTEIPAAGLHGVGWRALPGNLARVVGGYRAARRVLADFRPDALLFTGGYVAVPMALAARGPQAGRKRPRSMVYVPDIEPGLALKVIARFADRIALTTPDSQRFFPAKERLVVTGYPCRGDLAGWDRQAARQKLALEAELPVVLVFGGSKGARSINQALIAALPALLPVAQVLHIAGRLDWEEVQGAQRDLAAQLPPQQASRYHAYPYLHEEMGAAFAAADLAVSRAGASTLGELPLFGLPAILVPYPYAWRYQKVNADYLAQRGAAVIVPDADLATQLLPEVRRLLGDPETLARMQTAMQALARPGAALALAQQIRILAAHGPEV